MIEPKHACEASGALGVLGVWACLVEDGEESVFWTATDIRLVVGKERFIRGPCCGVVAEQIWVVSDVRPVCLAVYSRDEGDQLDAISLETFEMGGEDEVYVKWVWPMKLSLR